MRWAALAGAVVAVALSVVAAAKARPLAAPSATTGPVSGVTADGATVSGSVDPGGEATTWWVDFGTSTAYGKKTASKSAGSGSGPVSVSATLTGLMPATVYHYRVSASNGAGTVHGADGIVTTLSAPAVASSDANEIGPFKARLHGSVNPHGLATTWLFEYGTTTAYGSKTPVQNLGSGTSAQSVSFLVQGLQSGSTYHFRLVAANAAGMSVTGDRAFTTDPPPTVKPAPATNVTASSATLNGLLDPHNRGTTYWFEYGTSKAYGSKTASRDAYWAGDRGVATDAGNLKPGTTYHFRLVARSDAGTTVGADGSFRTTTAPTVVTRAASQVGADRATLTADVNPQGRSTSWVFEYGTTTSYGSQTSVSLLGGGTRTLTVSFQVTGLHASTTYHFRIAATSAGGTTRGQDLSFTTLGPPSVQTGAVTRLSTSTAVIGGRVNPLGLAASTWLEYGRTSSYGLRADGGSLQSGTGDTAVTFTLSGLAPGARYHYRVVAQSAGGTTVGRDLSFGTSPWPRDARGRRVPCTIVGTVEPDRLRGTPGPDVICGLGGGDVITGAGGDDVIYGGPGDDVLDGGAGNDRVYGGAGDDRVAGSTGRDRLDGGRGADVLLGGPGRDELLAADGRRDTVNGGPGRDSGRLDRRRDRRVSVERLLRG